MKIVFTYKHLPGQHDQSTHGNRHATSLPDGKFFTDNPGKEYSESHPNSITAYFRGLYVNPQELLALNVPGKMGEHKNINRTRVEQLADSMRKEGFRGTEYAPLICVEQDGTARVWEGNHRIRAAAQAGIEAMPLDVRYYGGGETVPGKFSPKEFRKIAENYVESQ